jgi:anti-anti-sigma factor
VSERASGLQSEMERAPRALPIVSREPGCSVVILRGDLDLAGTAAFVDALATVIGRDDADVVVDFAKVRTMGVAAVAKLARGREYLHAHGRSLVIRFASEPVQRVLAECGVSDLVESVADLDGAGVDADDDPAAAAAQLLREAMIERRAAAADRQKAALLYRQAALDRAAAGVDDLTGALRRDRGFGALRLEIDRCRRTGDRLVVGFVDVDGLKRVNDTRGHQSGDQLLKAVVSELIGSLRSYDIVVRFGGDEFVYSLAGADIGAARSRFEAMQESLLASHGDSVSAGFAELGANDTLEALIARADADLYHRRGLISG